jgi:hypothetical protein
MLATFRLIASVALSLGCFAECCDEFAFLAKAKAAKFSVFFTTIVLQKCT